MLNFLNVPKQRYGLYSLCIKTCASSLQITINIDSLCVCPKSEQTYHNFLLHVKPEIYIAPDLKLKLHVHLTKSSKRDNVSKLCLYMVAELLILVT